jgi:predicted flap endonuclease-1-like 5' DNA nuclease
MTYKIQHIEGVGAEVGARLEHAGVTNSDQLLTRCATDEGRRALAIAANVSVEQLKTWSHQADLMRVSGIGSEFGQLLERSGVETVAQLSERKPENLVNLLTRVNAEKRLTRAVPALATVSKWVTRAREMTTTSRATTDSTAPHFAVHTLS